LYLNGFFLFLCANTVRQVFSLATFWNLYGRRNRFLPFVATVFMVLYCPVQISGRAVFVLPRQNISPILSCHYLGFYGAAIVVHGAARNHSHGLFAAVSHHVLHILLPFYKEYQC
jgi:hypothetical protein